MVGLGRIGLGDFFSLAGPVAEEGRQEGRKEGESVMVGECSGRFMGIVV